MSSIERDPLAGLTPRERQRLARFGAAFERLDAAQYSTLSDGGQGEVVRHAQAHALETIGHGPRHHAVAAAVRAFVDDAATAYSRRISLPDQVLIYQSLPDRPEDRVRFLQSLERAVVAVILDDQLAEDDRAALLGPWTTLIDAAEADEGGEA